MWQGSLAQQWSRNFANNNLKDFEGTALLKTTKSDKEFSTFSEGLNDSVTFGAADGVLNDDKVFFLSGEEVYNPKFGFETEKSQITKLNKKAASWMLRSPSSENDLVIEVIDGYLGGATDAFVNSNSNAARPAVNLNKSNIVLATPAEATKVDFSKYAKADTMEWKLTLKDSSNFSEGASVESDLATGNAVNLPKDYSNKIVSVNHKKLSSFNKDYTNVTAVLKDVNGNILYYGSIGNDIESGKSMIAIPEKLAAGDYNVEVYGEKWNPNKESDSATGIPYIFTLKVAGDDEEQPTDTNPGTPEQPKPDAPKPEEPADPTPETPENTFMDLKDGQYNVNVSMLQEGLLSELSMVDRSGGLNHNAVLVVEGGKLKLNVTFNPINVGPIKGYVARFGTLSQVIHLIVELLRDLLKTQQYWKLKRKLMDSL